MWLFFRYNYKLSILEYVYNVLQWSFEIRVWFGLTPPPQLWSKTMTIFCSGTLPLATKLLQMSRKHLGINIQFFSSHGWWRRHLMTARLSKVDQCRLCLEDQAVECPIHLFSECPALAWLRQELFNDSYPTQSMGQQICVRSVNLPYMARFKPDWENRSKFQCSLDGIDTAKGSGLWG